MKLHPSGLDLREVEDVVDQGEQVPARTEHPIERLDVLFQRLGILSQHLGDTDDRPVQWRQRLSPEMIGANCT